jgi:GntP family gluconate:H+ symporter
MVPEVLFVLVVLLGMVLVYVLVVQLDWPAAIALVLGALFVGVCSGVSPPDMLSAFNEGIGSVLSQFAFPLVFGVMLGRLLAASGSARVLALALGRVAGPDRMPLLLAALGLLAGVPLMLGVGLLLLWPVLFALALELRVPVLRLGLPLAAGFSMAHGLAPPHPGPVVALEVLGAEMASALGLGLIISVPVVLLVGLSFGGFISSRVKPQSGGLGGDSRQAGTIATAPPSLAHVLGVLLVPVGLMSLGTALEVLRAEVRFLTPLEPGSPALPWTYRLVHDLWPWGRLVGSPLVALTVGVLVALAVLGRRCGPGSQRTREVLEKDLGPLLLLILAMGGAHGFGRILDYAGAGGVIVGVAFELPGSPLLVGWLVAALVRASSGSVFAAITMAANVMAPVAAGTSGLQRDLLLVSIGAGSLFFSFVNDGAFWFVKTYFNLTVTETVRTWTVLQALLSLSALFLILLLGALF